MVDKNDVIIIGYGCCEVVIFVGFECVLVIVCDDLSDDEVCVKCFEDN